MAIQIQLRQGTTTEHNTFTGAVGEVTVDTTKDVPVVHDGVTVGGHPVAAKANTDGTISLIKKDGTSAGTINALGLFNNTLTSTNTNQALTAAQGKVLNDQAFGVEQNWMNVKSERSLGTTYTNTTGKPIYVTVVNEFQNYGDLVEVFVNNIKLLSVDKGFNVGWLGDTSFVVPAGQTYKVTKEVYPNIQSWVELR